jgi:two-component sensor histidine kinase
MSLDDLFVENVFAALPASCMMLDRDLRFVAASRGYLDTVECDFAAIRGRFVFDAFPESEERRAIVENSFRAALAGEDNTLTELLFSIPDHTAQGAQRDVWWNCQHVGLRDANGAITHVIQHAEDVTEAVKARALNQTIVGEMQHRIGNLLSLVLVIARRTAANSDDLNDFQHRFEGRITALAETHSQLTGGNWNGMTLGKLIEQQLKDYRAEFGPRMVLGGPDLHLDAAEAQTISLAIHELTTNSIKYGALNGAAGHLNIRWDRAGSRGYLMEWLESGLTDLSHPEREGFGSAILTRLVPAQLDGMAEREFHPGGMNYKLWVRADA